MTGDAQAEGSIGSRVRRHWPTVVPLLAFVTLILSWEQKLGPVATVLVGLVLIGAVLAAVHHAEVVAHRVGEPYGSLTLAIAVTVIEVGLILTLMISGGPETASLARDTVFAAVMIILNLLLGLCLLASGIHYKEQRFTRTGANAALSTLTTLMVLVLVLPNYTTSFAGPVYTGTQLSFVAAFSLILYLTFVFVQTVRNRDYFLPSGASQSEPEQHAEPPSNRQALSSFAALLVSLGAVVLMAKSLPAPLEAAVASAGLPFALVGIAIAGIVLLPEGFAAVRAARSRRLQTSLNLALGSALATIGLTIPAVTVVSFSLGLPLVLGLDAKSVTLLALTVVVASLSLARGRTTVLHGAVHLVIFAAYLMTTVIP